MTNSVWDMQNKWQRAWGELEFLDRVMSQHTNMYSIIYDQVTPHSFIESTKNQPGAHPVVGNVRLVGVIYN